MYIFVYGTLKHGHGLNQMLIHGGAKFIGWGYMDNVRLYSWGLCPAAYPGIGSQVWGEIYNVDASLLEQLDRIEASYDRVQKPVVITEGNVDLSPVTAWIYMGATEPMGGKWLKDGVFTQIF